jgi:preprotein translocase subunit SecG
VSETKDEYTKYDGKPQEAHATEAMQEQGYTATYLYRTNYFYANLERYKEISNDPAVSSRRRLADAVQDVIQVNCGSECEEVRRILGKPEFASKLNELSGDHTVVNAGSAVTLSSGYPRSDPYFSSKSFEPQYRRATITLGVLFFLALVVIAVLVQQLRQAKGQAAEETPVGLDKLHDTLEQGELHDTIEQAPMPKKLLNKKKAHHRPDAPPPLVPLPPRLPSPTEFVQKQLSMESDATILVIGSV